MKVRQDNDMIDLIDAVYIENKTTRSRLIRPGTVCDENQIGQ